MSNCLQFLFLRQVNFYFVVSIYAQINNYYCEFVFENDLVVLLPNLY